MDRLSDDGEARWSLLRTFCLARHEMSDKNKRDHNPVAARGVTLTRRTRPDAA